ncbi:related to molybdenum cofactor sulfurase HxB protein [Sporisorium reilianum f. sp. reilianum]|uniref:Molybdenum cofactor sulfurase n=1 Tax=Sporisorium reilianum f. sp. reilianum TaxID=72559 RepID=A0A2N8UGC5_9BASI|nr:related to molybdenum cofactor sulfurase HxB protein [Sporisorium reilianum f. sp. reilianum]
MSTLASSPSMATTTSQKALAVALLCLASPYIASALSRLSIAQRVALSAFIYVAVSAHLQHRSAKRFQVALTRHASPSNIARPSSSTNRILGDDQIRRTASTSSTVARRGRSGTSASRSVPTDEATMARSVARIRNEQCPQLSDACYLDAAAAPPFPSGLVTAVAQDLTGKLLSNPHSKSPSAISTADQIAATRLRVMREVFGIQDTHDWHLIFTSGTTASLKLVGESFDWASFAQSVSGKPGFSYLVESHTSAVGIRDLAARAGARSTSLTQDEMASGVHEGLVVLPLQCNATGKRYVDLMTRVCRSKADNTLVMVDAASYLSSSQRFDLSQLGAGETPDMVAFSFYKIFGYPTGLGGLLVKASAAPRLNRKTYFGGGTVDSILADTRWTKPRKDFEARLEDGTVNIHGILAVNTALDFYRQAFGPWDLCGGYVAGLRSNLVQAMRNMKHGNGNSVIRLYTGNDAEAEFGSIVNFNVLAANGSVVPPQEVDRLASISNIHLRMGRHCNPGFVTSQLGVTADQIKQEYADGVGCDGAGDGGVEGSSKASASLRASLCLLNTDQDVERLVGFLARFFLSSSPTCQHASVGKNAVERQFELANITVYPIKSCAGQDLAPGEKWELTRHGLKYDREWIVMNLSNGKALSQKRFPKMALIRPRIDLRARTMTIAIAGTTHTFTLDVDDECQYIDDASGLKKAEICGMEVRPRAHRSEVLRSMLTDLLGVSCTLARQATDVRRHSKLDSGSDKIPLIFSNESPFLLINSASVDQVSRWMQHDAPSLHPSSAIEDVASDSGYSSASHADKTYAPPVHAQAASFRANFLVSPTTSGTEAPFAEDSFSRVVLGGSHVFGVLGECRRCQMVCVDQRTGEVRPQTLKTLAKWRRNAKGRIIFGSHLAWLPELALGADGEGERAHVWVGMRVVAS